MGVKQKSLEAAADDLEVALEEAESDEARYYIREAAQRVVAAGWDEEN